MSENNKMVNEQQAGSSRKEEKEEHLKCKPLDTYDEILDFLENPPPWRALCEEITPHSQFMIRNMEVNTHFQGPILEAPDSFCHFNPDAEDVVRHSEKSLPKTLVCHDMANGYHDDSYIDGTGKYDAYTFYNWAGIDIFCYFSHHLITIPPLGWINVGHAHGVKVIGTVISEWAEGVLFWDYVLGSETQSEHFANALVAMAKTLKFDGWLLNVENKISHPTKLLAFVQYLHRILHQAIPDGLLIWYDCVTIQGTLNWQNGLNEKNKAFFNACDGIFTNYSWTVKDVKRSAENAGERARDVFVGVDVWGRNFYGGGGFNTMEAVRVVYEHGCSLAIFGQAWTHEAMAGGAEDDEPLVTGDENMDRFDEFLLRDRALWSSLWPFLNTRVPCRLPFQTSFCKGRGERRRANGEVVGPTPWYNLRHQRYQPNSALGPHGYLLSTTDEIVRVSQQAMVRKGILRYRPSFLRTPRPTPPASRHDDSDDDDEELPADAGAAGTRGPDLDTAAETRSDVPGPEFGPERAPRPADSEETATEDWSRLPNDLKKKMIDVFRSLFRRKSRGCEGEADEAAAGAAARDEEEEAGPGPSRRARPAGSVENLSVHVRLGMRRAADRPRLVLAAVPRERECFEVYGDDSFDGGSCLLVNPSDETSPEHRTSRLFHCDFEVKRAVIACVVTKKAPGFPRQGLNVKLFMKNSRGQQYRAVLVGYSLPQRPPPAAPAPVGSLTVYAVDPTSPRFRRLQRHLLLDEPRFYVPVENSFGWTVRYFEVTAPGCRITSVNCKTEMVKGPILLGHFGICLWDGSDDN